MMKTVNIRTMVWTGVVLVACLLLPAQLTAEPALEYLFNETGTRAENTGHMGGAPLADWGTFYDYTGNVPPWNHIDSHSADGTGVSGLPGDRAFNQDEDVFGNGGGMWGHTGVHTSTPEPYLITQSLTISGWLKDIKYVNAPKYIYFNSNGSGPPTRTAVLLHPGGTLQLTLSDGGNNISVDGGFPMIWDFEDLPDQYTFFAVTWDGTGPTENRMKWYIGGETTPVTLMNEKPSGSDGGGGGWTENNKWFSLMNIGNAHGGINGPVKGLMDNFRLHQGGIGDGSGALTIQELEALRAGDAAPVIPSGSLWEIGTPITAYGHGPGANFGWLSPTKAAELAENGFNMVWATTPTEINYAGAEGLRALYYVDSYYNDPTILDTPAGRAALSADIDTVKDNPAMYAYYMGDEPSATEFEGLGNLAAYIRERDPNHMMYINLLPTYASGVALLGPGANPGAATVADYREYLRQYVTVVKPDMISYDHYHFRDGYDGSQYFLNLALVREAALNAGIPFSNYVQAVSLAPSGWRVPTPSEGRWLAYTTLAYGGQGLQQFTYYGYSEFEGGVYDPYPPGTNMTPLGEALRDEINPNFVAVAEQLQPLRSIGAYHKGAQPLGTELLPGDSPFDVSATTGILLGLFGPDDQYTPIADATYALVVNLNYTSGITTTVFGPGDLSVFDATTGLWSAMGIDQVLLNLVPGGGTLVGLTSAILFPTTLLGDANLDGIVGLQDFSILKANFGTTGGWGEGNFNGDNLIDLQDFSILKAHFGEHLPEPATLTLLLLGGLALLRRRR